MRSITFTLDPLGPQVTKLYRTGKKHRGEPGHSRDTRDTRTHKGTRTTQTNLTGTVRVLERCGFEICGCVDMAPAAPRLWESKETAVSREFKTF